MTDLHYPKQRWIDWVERASAAIEVDPAAVDIVDLHHLSKEVAHRLERPMAPVSAFILGLALGAAGDVSASRRTELLDKILDTLPAPSEPSES